MTNIRFALLIFLLACGGPSRVQSPAPASTPTAPTSKAQASADIAPAGDWEVSPDQDSTRFRSVEGVRLYLVPVRSKSKPELRNRYFLRITGSSSKSDGLVLLVRREVGDFTTHYGAQLRGGTRALLTYRKPSKARNLDEKWTVSGYGDHPGLGRFEVVDEEVDAEAIVALRQQQQGLPISEIETLDPVSGRAWTEKRLADHATTVSTQCGPVELSIDWTTVQESWIGGESLAEKCAVPLELLGELCERYPGKLQNQTKPTRLQCVFGPELRPKAEERLTKVRVGEYQYSPSNTSGRRARIMHFWRRELGEEKQVLRAGELQIVINHSAVGSRLFHGRGTNFFPITKDYGPDVREFIVPSGSVRAQLSINNGNWQLGCGTQKRDLETVTGKARTDILEKATYESEPRWKRIPYFLSRDSKGTYYYVDKFSDRFGGGRYRVFVGRKGEVKLSKLKRLVEDSEGTLFSTTRGDLRLVVSAGSKQGRWIQGKKSTDLTSVSIYKNPGLIYDELGVYFGEKLGFLCD